MTSLLLVIIVFGISSFQISSETALYAVALALAMIPESLLAIITITLARGVSRMHKRHAVIRRLDAIETIGGVGAICLDKTGTLTLGNMEVRTLWNGTSLWKLSGTGDGLDKVRGECECSKCPAGESIKDLVRCLSLCNNATVKKTEEGWLKNGDSTEVFSLRYD